MALHLAKPRLPPEMIDLIYKHLHRSYMNDICNAINHNLVWVRGKDKKTKRYVYTFLIGENRRKNYWEGLPVDEEGDAPIYHRLPCF